MTDIEPPYLVRNAKDGANTIKKTIGAFEMVCSGGKPMVALLYLKFKSEKALYSWTGAFERAAIACWERLGHQDIPYFVCVINPKEPLVVDIVWTSSLEILKESCKLRFPSLRVC